MLFALKGLCGKLGDRHWKINYAFNQTIKIVMCEPLDLTLCFSGFVNHVGLGDSTALKTLPSGFALGAKHTLIKVGISSASST